MTIDDHLELRRESDAKHKSTVSRRREAMDEGERLGKEHRAATTLEDFPLLWLGTV